MPPRQKPRRKPGRPAGVTTTAAAIVATFPAACPRCQSTDRESIRIVRERAIAGTMPNGQPQTHIVWRRVRCNACGQYWIEREHQNRVPEAPPKETIENPD